MAKRNANLVLSFIAALVLTVLALIYSGLFTWLAIFACSTFLYYGFAPVKKKDKKEEKKKD